MILPGPKMMPMAGGGGGGFPDGTTFNPTDKSSEITLASGNLSAQNTSGASSYTGVRANIGVSEGKYYWEVEILTSARITVGIAPDNYPFTSFVGAIAGYSAFGWVGQFSQVYSNGNVIAPDIATSFTSGDIVGVALDLDNLKVHFSKNGSWLSSSVPSTGAGGYSIPPGTYYPIVTLYAFPSRADATFNAPFAYTPPAGFAP